MTAPPIGIPDWINGDPTELRRIRASAPEVVSPTLPADVTITPLPAAGPCPGGLVFTPTAATGIPILYFHGGGFIVGSPETHRIVTAWIAHLTRAPVISIRYRLAPEHPLPAQAYDATSALQRQLSQHDGLRLMGDSAGAMVALWGHAGLPPEDRSRITDATLFYPGGLPFAPLPTTADESDGLGPRSLASYHRRLDPTNLSPGNPGFDPLSPDFPLPARMTLLAAAHDPVRNQAELLSRLPGARLILAQGQGHGFLSTLPAPAALTALRAALTPA